jgi:hypothetical protein
MSREVGARLLTVAGTILVVLGLTVIPWGAAGIEASPSDVRAIYDDYRDPDFNASLEIAYHAWGFLLFMALCVLGVVLVLLDVDDRPVPALVATLVAVAACGAWHQGGIGTITNLGLGAYTPEIGAALVVVGLWISITGDSSN